MKKVILAFAMILALASCKQTNEATSNDASVDSTSVQIDSTKVDTVKVK